MLNNTMTLFGKNSTNATKSALDMSHNDLILFVTTGGIAISMLFLICCFTCYHLWMIKRERDKKTFIIANEEIELRLSQESSHKHEVDELEPSSYERLEDGLLVSGRIKNYS